VPTLAPHPTVYAFGSYELDLALYELRRGGRRVAIEPKALDLLACLVGDRQRVVTKVELLQRLWPREVVTDASLTYCVRAARQAVGDDGTRQRIITTVRGRGYRFIAPLHESPQALAAASAPPQAVTRVGNGGFFVGREAAMASLRGALEAVLGGRGRVALLVGEAGIGKTRTAEELATHAAGRGARVLFGRCYEGAGAPAFWPWMQVIREHVTAQQPSAALALMQGGAAELAQLVPEIAAWLPQAPPALDAESDRARFTLFDSCAAFLRRAAAAEPLVIILDDLHWADAASLLLLHFVARECGAARLLLIGTYRDERRDAAHPLTRCLGELARLDACQRLELRGLTTAEIARFIEASTGAVPMPTVLDAVVEQTGGNPFFMTELVHLLRGEPAPRDATTLGVPTGVREAVARRVALLTPLCRALLPVAAVIGREFDLPLLRHAARRATTLQRVLDALDEAAAAHLIEPLPGAAGRYRFAHALVRETLYDGMAIGVRARIHARVGDALAARHRADLTPLLSVLAHHYAEAAPLGTSRQAIDFAVRAGRHAAAGLAYEEASFQLGRALELLDVQPPRRRRAAAMPRGISAQSLRLEMGENLWRGGDIRRAREIFERAAAHARHRRAAPELARAALGYGGGFRGFDVGMTEPRLVELLEEALAALPHRPDALQARVMARLAVALYHVPNSLERRQALSRDAVAIAARSADDAAHLGALYSRHWAIWGPDNLDDRIEAATAMIEIATRIGDDEMALHAHRFHLIDMLELGDLAAVDADFAVCAELAATLRQPYYRWYVEYLRAMRAQLEGRLADAEQLAVAALAIGQRAESGNVAQIYGGQMLWLRREQGRLGEVEPVLRAMVEQYPALPSWRCALVYALSELGRLDEARSHLAILATNDFRDLPRNAFWMIALYGLGHASATLGDARRARAAYDLLAPHARRIGESNLGATCLGSLSGVLGRLAATERRWQLAERHFEHALAVNEGLGAPHLAAHVRYEFAEMLLARAAPHDHARARDLLSRAAATYRQLGMASFAERAAALLAQSRSARARPTQKSDRIRLVR